MNPKKYFRLNNVIFTTVKEKSINDVAIPTRSSNGSRYGVIILGAVNVFDAAHDEILLTKFSREELKHNEFILEGE